MTSLAAYAAFLTARWNELEKVAREAKGCPGGAQGVAALPEATRVHVMHHGPIYELDDLAAKRAILDDAVESARWATNPDCPPESAPFYRDRAGHLGDALHHLAEPFRDHPDHPANQEQP